MADNTSANSCGLTQQARWCFHCCFACPLLMLTVWTFEGFNIHARHMCMLQLVVVQQCGVAMGLSQITWILWH